MPSFIASSLRNTMHYAVINTDSVCQFTLLGDYFHPPCFDKDALVIYRLWSVKHCPDTVLTRMLILFYVCEKETPPCLGEEVLGGRNNPE